MKTLIEKLQTGRDLAIVNAAGGFVVAGLAQNMNEGIALAREQIDSGRALGKLRSLQDYKAKSLRQERSR